jgi:serine phosphatase RsbU (regulator of sigma subunit)/anti-sigma regulatory factor (Ser/Thr protein kinase)
MLNLTTSQQFDLFNSFAEHWQKVTGSELYLLSSEGEFVTSSNGAPSVGGAEILSHASPSEPTFFTHAQQSILTAPLAQNNQTLGYLLALDATEKDASLLQWGAETFAARLVDTDALHNMTDELIGAWDQLELIYRVTQNLALTSDLMAALKSILKEIRQVVDTEDGFILLKQADTLSGVACLQENVDDTFYNRTLLNNLISANKIIVCNDNEACRQVWPDIPVSIESLLATPLTIIEEDSVAAIGLINKANKNFNAGDAKLLAALAQQVATIIKNFITHQKLISEERLSRELEIAAEIQESLLPTKLPQVGGISMAVSSIPASEVGGDFYDFITIDDRHLTLVIGDVSGKGVPAAMLTSVTRTMLRVEATRGEPPEKIIDQANSVLYQDLSRADSFVTVFVATIDTFESKLTYASAGHTPSLLWRAETREIELLKATSPPIGIIDSQGNNSRTVDLYPGDTLVFYTDGITEAHSPNNDLFGLNRLIYIVESRAKDPPEVLQQYIQSEVVNFWRHASGRDDATLLIVKILPHPDEATPQDISTVVKAVDFLYPAETDYLSQIPQDISTICRELPSLPAGSRGNDFIYLIELAISEICTNIVKHAYAGTKGEISGQITLLNNGIQLDFYDRGAGFDPNTVPEPKSDPDNLTEGGYGLHIVRQIMDVVSYTSEPKKGNHWHLIKFLPS